MRLHKIENLLTAKTGNLPNAAVASVTALSFNYRLAQQQGLFLVNLSEAGLSESLSTMMSSSRKEWFKVFDIDARAIPEIERKLFQMNIHEQSLFPDLEGLAGFIGQKIRLHWTAP